MRHPYLPQRGVTTGEAKLTHLPVVGADCCHALINVDINKTECRCRIHRKFASWVVTLCVEPRPEDKFGNFIVYNVEHYYGLIGLVARMLNLVTNGELPGLHPQDHVKLWVVNTGNLRRQKNEWILP